jgi:hypothetical protein
MLPNLKAKTMITAHYEIEFAFSLDDAKLALHLSADVEVHHSEFFYIVKNIRRKGASASVLPQICIKKVASRWVHSDSGKSSQLSEAAGEAIDAQGT